MNPYFVVVLLHFACLSADNRFTATELQTTETVNLHIPSVLLPSVSIPHLSGAGDFNADGTDDIFFNDHNSSTVLLGNSAPTSAWTDRIPLGIPTPVTSSAGVGDFNGDHIADVAAVSGSTLTVAFGSSGTVTTLSIQFPSLCGTVQSAGDFNRDAISDIVVACTNPNSVWIVFGRNTWENSGYQISEVTHAEIRFTESVTTVASAADFDKDGTSDVVIGQHDVVYVLFGSNARYATTTTLTESELISPVGFRLPLTDTLVGAQGIGDFNNDGVEDIVICTTHRVQVFLGAFGRLLLDTAATITFQLPNDTLQLFAVAPAGDFNKDGISDLQFVSQFETGSSTTTGATAGGGVVVPLKLSIIFGRSDWSSVQALTPYIDCTIIHCVVITLTAIPDSLLLRDVGDVNNDGVTDLLVASTNRAEVLLSPYTATPSSRGGGGGAPAAGVGSNPVVPSGPSVTTLVSPAPAAGEEEDDDGHKSAILGLVIGLAIVSVLCLIFFFTTIGFCCRLRHAANRAQKESERSNNPDLEPLAFGRSDPNLSNGICGDGGGTPTTPPSSATVSRVPTGTKDLYSNDNLVPVKGALHNTPTFDHPPGMYQGSMGSPTPPVTCQDVGWTGRDSGGPFDVLNTSDFLGSAICRVNDANIDRNVLPQAFIHGGSPQKVSGIEITPPTEAGRVIRSCGSKDLDKMAARDGSHSLGSLPSILCDYSTMGTTEPMPVNGTKTTVEAPHSPQSQSPARSCGTLIDENDTFSESSTFLNKWQGNQLNNPAANMGLTKTSVASLTAPTQLAGACGMWKLCPDVLGKGGYGTVYLGMSDNGELVAIKKMMTAAGTLPKEIRLMKKYQHNNLVKYLDTIISEDNTMYIVMEYISGGSLKTLLKKFRKLELNQSRKFVRDICQGIQYLHSNNIIHRDIKPDNILINASGTAKLADFGIALLCGSSSVLGRHTSIGEASVVASVVNQGGSVSGVITGTPQYIAPELLTGASCKAQDIWALGITVVEMLCGLDKAWCKYHYTNQFQMLFLLSKPDTTPNVPEDLDGDAKDFINCCLNKDSKQRATVDELLKHRWLKD